MENRPWWKEGDWHANLSGINFIWTAVKEDFILDTFRSKLETPSLRADRIKLAQMSRPLPAGIISHGK